MTDDITATLSERAATLNADDLEGEGGVVARQCLLDWLGVSYAARAEPLVDILAATAEPGDACTLIGRGARASVADAVLVNGAMGHALDYDDVIITMGHPTVPVAPVVMAMAEQKDLPGIDLLTAFVAGVEAECAVARLLGPSHYARGWHGTATYGTFGATAAAGRLLGLDGPAMARAFGIAGTQAAGLKSMFGTMCKPLHAGKAAANGLLAARLAAGGFTSNTRVLDTPQGFGATQSDALNHEAALAGAPGLHIRRTLFKFHAACYLTHSSITAATKLRSEGLNPARIAKVELGVDPGHLKVCAIPEPTTGLECKFSLAMTTALALHGENTADEALYSDATAARGDLQDLARRVTLSPRRADSPTLAEVTVTTDDGRTLTASHDVGIPAADVEAQWAPLEAKFRALVEESLGSERTDEVVRLVRSLDELPSIRPLIALVA